jgi:hypothetical protein
MKRAMSEILINNGMIFDGEFQQAIKKQILNR